MSAAEFMLEKNEKRIVHSIKGLKIEIWVEMGILMASVKNRSDASKNWGLTDWVWFSIFYGYLY